MARTVTLRTFKEVEALARKQGMHLIDAGLYLQVKGKARSWVYRYTLKGKARWSGLGAYPDVSLANARGKRDAERNRLRDGIDPVAERKAKRSEKAAPASKRTFHEVAKTYIADNGATWNNPVHRKQWPSSLETYVYPTVGEMPVDEITVAHVCAVLRPVWIAKAETAGRIRGRIEKILDAAKALGLRSGENPATLGNVTAVLPKRAKKRQRVKHHPALPYAQVPSFMAKLRQIESVSAKALEFVILTVCRSGDIIGQKREDRPAMMWSHVDLGEKLWTIPKTKNDSEHRVPLSDAAIAVLRSVEDLDETVVFPSPNRPGEALSNNAMLALLDRMSHGDVTVHGFRSSFRDWAAETTAYPNYVAEMALAHTVGNEVEAAYRRGDLLIKRTKLMEDWAAHCGRAPAGNVESLDQHRQRQAKA